MAVVWFQLSEISKDTRIIGKKSLESIDCQNDGVFGQHDILFRLFCFQILYIDSYLNSISVKIIFLSFFQLWHKKQKNNSLFPMSSSKQIVKSILLKSKNG